MQIRNRWKKPILLLKMVSLINLIDIELLLSIAQLQQVKRAFDEGANVIAYLHWSQISLEHSMLTDQKLLSVINKNLAFEIIINCSKKRWEYRAL
ncbi:MAG: hypothetical protein K0S91_2542 [Nitrososphaeraceae archaeon]|jgi:hypothetical protein|nr:hypothetical protein [Nitrososphaeraceae archaeon]